MTIRGLLFDGEGTLWDPARANEVFPGVRPAVEALGRRYVLGLVTDDATGRSDGPLGEAFDFRLATDDIGIRTPDTRRFAVAAAAAGCHPNELVSVGDDPEVDVASAQALGCRAVLVDRTGSRLPAGIEPDAIINDLGDLPAVLARFEADDAAKAATVGVGPHPTPWPDDDRLDPTLLAEGDRRNVIDRFRYWREDAIVADLDTRRHPFHVAVENWRHDRNIGAVVRNANAFGATAVHIVGRRRWNRRGAMATDRYLDVRHHDSIETFVAWCDDEHLPILAIDNVAGSTPIEHTPLPNRCVLAFGQEGPGLSADLLTRAVATCAITQYGSTRSINAGVASGIAMHAWLGQHAGTASPPGWPSESDDS